MKIWFLGTALGLCVLAFAGLVLGVEVHDHDVREWMGNDRLTNACLGEDRSCYGYIAAVDDLITTVQRSPAFCYGPDVKIKDLTRAYVEYMRHAPESERQRPAPSSIMAALAQNWPCKEGVK